MTKRSNPVRLAEVIRSHLENCSDDLPGARKVLDRLGELRLLEVTDTEANLEPPAHDDVLQAALASISDSSLVLIGEAIHSAASRLRWNVDRGHYYKDAEAIGDGYANGNMNCELIGSAGAAFRCEDFSLGLFLLAPRILYRDHNHRAPELYVNLTGPTGWRFDRGEWHDHPAGALIWNDSYRVHATRMYGTPFLAVYCWTRDIDAGCEVIPADDWDQIEAGL